jgi:HAD superfamily phosphoserine phosphatase-like hydrolase
MAKSRKKRKVAVFDIDGTIFRSSLLIELVEALILERVFPASVRRIYVREYRRWLERKDSYEKYISAVVVAFEKNIKGVKEKDFLLVAKKVIAFNKNRVYRYSRDLVRDLRKKNYYLLAISHSPFYVAAKFAKQLGFDKTYSRLLEMDGNRRFTGTTLYADLIYDKAKILQRAIEKGNLTLNGSIGVGDTESDISFLKMVERPICFNPNQTLYRIAKKNHWPVVVERKDVIYKIGHWPAR